MEDLQQRLEKIEALLLTQKAVLTVKETCTLTGLSKSTLYKLTMKGRIPHYKQGKHLYFKRVEVESWLTSQPQTKVNDLILGGLADE